MQLIRSSLSILTAAMLAACATQPPEPPGRHLVVRDQAGKLLMQFDYPNDEMCARTAMAMRGSDMKAGCAQASSADALRGRATLRYNPPGVMVEGHYQDLAACRTMTRQLAGGVEMMQACSAK